MSFSQRTHTCGELRLSDLDKNVTLNGWVAKKRDLGGLFFIDLRDRYGITQLKISPDNKALIDIAASLGNEFVISATGKVIKRESINKNIPTGDIEIEVSNIEVLNESKQTPFVVEEDVKASEELRFKYRYLDLRRQSMTQNMIVRNQVFQIVHKYFEKHGFLEIETPILMKSTPEGARDYLVPSRVHKGKFYALPQSPQTYKQILMVAGIDKYVQICKCFRDEDLRADRQPEFTQIDLEMSFVKQEDVFRITEGLMKEIWKGVLNIDIDTPFTQLTYDECIKYYGIDKPDLRIKGDMRIADITHHLANTQFSPFKSAIDAKGIIAGIKLKGQNVSRKIIDSLTEIVKSNGLGGLAYIKLTAEGVQSPLTKSLGPEEIKLILESFESPAEGDTIFILSGEFKKVSEVLGLLRLNLADTFNLYDDSKPAFLWVTDFPLFRYDEEEKRYAGEHHIFTMPKAEHLHLLESDKPEDILAIRADCYDLVLNGQELASGSIRIHKSDIQKRVFDIIGLTDEESRQKFGFVLDAFSYGAPPHGGIAPGLDRIVASLCGTKDIREVIAFPKTTSAASLMDENPSPVSEQQLKELGIKLV